MIRRSILILIALAALIVGFCLAQLFAYEDAHAATLHKPYLLKHPKHERCRTDYWKRVEHRRIHGREVKQTWCVWRAPKPAAGLAPASAPAVHPAAPAPRPSYALHAHLDPSFTQDPADPLNVTYSYSASAEQLTDGVSEDAPALPSGVLAFYSDGLLACSIDVGGAATGGECPVSYEHFGSHEVDVIYSSGEASATTGVETVAIEPPPVIPTSTTEEATADGCETVTFGGGSKDEQERCEYDVSATVTPTPPTGRVLVAVYANGVYVGAVEGGSCRVVTGQTAWNAESERLLTEGRPVSRFVHVSSPDCAGTGAAYLTVEGPEVEWSVVSRFMGAPGTLANPLGWEVSESETLAL
ncbi:MAG TPA: hypothetical protein VMB51_05155 [Solirubrobacteraceae bacterium]|nr:hypothetical protein [Solirubrobacteraceae bacterium]